MDETAQSQDDHSYQMIEIPIQDPVQEALDYAHQNDLLKDLDVDPVSEMIYASDVLQLMVPRTNPDGFTGDDHLGAFELPSVVSINDAWAVSSTSLTIIQNICRMPSDKEVQDLAKLACPLGSAKAMKLELPVLRSDNGFDYRQMCAQIRSRQEAFVGGHRLPLEPTDTEKDEGMEFPSAARQCSEILMKQIERETIDVPKDAFQYLANQLRTSWTEDAQWQLLKNELTHKRVRLSRLPSHEYGSNLEWQSIDLDRLTPPIIHDIEIPEYFIPSQEASLVPIPSDSSSTVSAELKDVEEALFQEVKADWTPDLLSSPAELRTISSSPVRDFLLSQSATRMRPGDLKLEAPLIRDKLGSASPDKQLMLEEIIKSLPQEECEQPFKDEEELEVSLKTELEQAEVKVMRSIEQEHLEPLDARARVPVPIMDFRIPEPEWTRLGFNARSLFSFIREGAGGDFNLPKWPKNRRREEKMWWQPLISGAGKISTDEPLDLDDDLVEKLLSLSWDSTVLSSTDFVWKRPGLAALRETTYKDEEEIEPAFPKATSPNDLMAIVKEQKKLSTKVSKDKSLSASQVPSGDQVDKTSHKRCPENVGDEPPLLAGDDGTTASTLLENFMKLHAQKRPKIAKSPYFAKCLEESVKFANLKDAMAPKNTQPLPLASLPSAPCPTVKPPSDLMKIIASVNLSPQLSKGLQQFIPHLGIVKRDYSAHNTSVWYPGSVCRSEVMPALAEEVDITISPATGIMITTMIKVRQKPVPGTKGRSVLRAFIEKASLRYERLIVLVSEGSRDDTMAAMSSSDATAFIELQGFAGSLDCNTSVIYVAGGDKALSSWIASLVSRYSQEARQIQHFLFDDETYWELYLRQAGMNTYAAQTISGILKAPDDSIESAQSGRYGLPGFINMSPADRATRFTYILGGRRVLDRVSRIVDATWG